MKELTVGLPATVDIGSAQVPGRVARIDPAASAGTVRIDVAFDGPLPPGARPDLTVDGVVRIERLPDTLHVGRPVFASAAGHASLFRLEPGGTAAVRVPVEFGKASITAVEIRAGLREGDSVILSDLGPLATVDRVRLR
jgi:HlyD family secretion protein